MDWSELAVNLRFVPPAPFLATVLPRLPAQGRALDVACGAGRNARALARHGLRVDALDRDFEALRVVAEIAARERLPVHPACVDLEDAAHAYPFPPARYDVVVVFRYLWRPRFADIVAALAPGGFLVYETYTTGQLRFADGPRRADFLLRPGELPGLAGDLHILVHDESDGPGEATARLFAQRRPENP